MRGSALSLAVSSPKSPNYLASYPIQIRAKTVEDDAHDPETSRSQNPHGLVAQHDLFARLAGHISPAGEPGRAGSGMGGGRNPVLAGRENCGEPEGGSLSDPPCMRLSSNFERRSTKPD